MYGIFTYIWLIFKLNVGIYTIHGSYGVGWDNTSETHIFSAIYKGIYIVHPTKKKRSVLFAAHLGAPAPFKVMIVKTSMRLV